MKKRTKEIEPSAVAIVNPVQIDNLAKSCSKRSSYFLSGAEDMLTSKSPLLSILLAYFAMEHKTYEILALNGIKIISHVCAIKGLSRIIGRKDLATVLSKAYENRLEVNYLGNIKTADMDKARAKEFIEKTALPFIKEIDKIASSLK
ncbi:hypothetical protein HYW99_04270 [Candidatus Woesearchaeota archaeon]|nr:hypothetical protein [Candidatus Woesearchaeota archaeon]